MGIICTISGGCAHPNSEEKNPLDEFSFLSASDSRAMAFSSLLDMTVDSG